ncbi:MAG: hypothetical protein AB8F95_08295, partial [Bacteroidia bacterium]
YREGDGYKVRMTIDSFKADLDARLQVEGETVPNPFANMAKTETPTHAPAPTPTGRWKTIALPDSEEGERKIFVKR